MSRLSVVAASFALASSGCSLVFVRGPPDHAGYSGRSERIECTSSKVAPILDSVVTGLEVARTVVAATAPDNVYEDALLPRGADIGLGLGFTALFLGSAIYGFGTTSRCAAAKRAHAERDTEADEMLPAARAPAPSLAVPSPAPSAAPALLTSPPPAPDVVLDEELDGGAPPAPAPPPEPASSSR